MQHLMTKREDVKCKQVMSLFLKRFYRKQDLKVPHYTKLTLPVVSFFAGFCSSLAQCRLCATGSQVQSENKPYQHEV